MNETPDAPQSEQEETTEDSLATAPDLADDASESEPRRKLQLSRPRLRSAPTPPEPAPSPVAASYLEGMPFAELTPSSDNKRVLPFNRPPPQFFEPDAANTNNAPGNSSTVTASDLQNWDEEDRGQEDWSEENAEDGDGAQATPPPEPISLEQIKAGEIDRESDPENPDTRRILAPNMSNPKLHKALAQSGIGSRLQIEEWIAHGRISVNGEPAHIGQRVQHGDAVRLDGKPVKLRLGAPPLRVLAYHKSLGEVVSRSDPEGRATVFDHLPPIAQGKWQNVGRLDINSEGLLLLTNSGDFANHLMHPRYRLEREYAVRSFGSLSEENREQLLQGIEVDDPLKQTRVRVQAKEIESSGEDGEGAANHWYRVVLAEGRNREVRRMFAAAGCQVSRLIRIRYGNVTLPRHLPRGQWMELSREAVESLRQVSQVPLAAEGAPRQNSEGQARHNEKRRTHLGFSGNGRNKKRPHNRPSGQSAIATPGNANNFPGAPGERPPSERPPRRKKRGPFERGPNPSAGNSGGGAFAPRGGGGGGQPDPMKTSFGYLEHGANSNSGGNAARRKARKNPHQNLFPSDAASGGRGPFVPRSHGFKKPRGPR